MRRIFTRIKLWSAALVLTISALLPLPLKAAGCNDIDVIYARGSGQITSATSGQAGYEAERDALFSKLHAAFDGNQNLNVSYQDLAAGMAGTSGNYPAVGIGGTNDPITSFLNMLNAASTLFDESKLSTYGNSVSGGVNLLLEYISNNSRVCPNTRYVLAGYSQGAQVMGNALSDSRFSAYLNNISYTALMGDPKFNQGTDASSAGVTQDVAWYRGGSNTNQNNIGGVLKARYPYMPNSLLYRVGSWCLNGDAICSNSNPNPNYLALRNNTAHGQYASAQNNTINDAVFEIASQVKSDLTELGGKAITTNLSSNIYKICNNAKQDIAILMDNTPAMAARAAFYQNMAVNVRNILQTSCDTRAAVVSFGLATDAQNPQILNGFTRDPTTNATSLLNTRANSTSTILAPTKVRQAMDLALDYLPWRQDAEKAFIIISPSIGDGYTAGARDYVSMDNLLKDSLTQQITQKARKIGGVGVHYARVINSGQSFNQSYESVPYSYYAALANILGGDINMGLSYLNNPFPLGDQDTWTQWNRYSLAYLSYQLLMQPKATLSPNSVIGTVNTPITLSLSNVLPGSYWSTGQISGYNWDLNCDGDFRNDGYYTQSITFTPTKVQSCYGAVYTLWNYPLGNGNDYSSRRYIPFKIDIKDQAPPTPEPTPQSSSEPTPQPVPNHRPALDVKKVMAILKLKARYICYTASHQLKGGLKCSNINFKKASRLSNFLSSSWLSAYWRHWF